MNYFEHLLVSGCVSISTFASVVGIPVEIIPFFVNNQKFKQSARKSLICWTISK